RPQLLCHARADVAPVLRGRRRSHVGRAAGAGGGQGPSRVRAVAALDGDALWRRGCAVRAAALRRVDRLGLNRRPAPAPAPGRRPHCADRFHARFGDDATPRDVADRPAAAPTPADTVAPTASLRDVPADAFARLTALATEALTQGRGVGAVLWGEAGPGRTT